MRNGTMIWLVGVLPVLVLMGCTESGGATLTTRPLSERLGAQGSSPGGSGLTIIPIDEVQKSQSGSVFQRVANTDIEVVYDRPVARGRELFGGIVPFDEVWNPGANDATAVTFSREVTVDGHRLQAGSYSLWAIPSAEEWTVIFSRAADVYHTPYPGKEHDALRLAIAPHQGSHVETLTFYFPMVEGKETELRLHWGETVVPMTIVVP